LESKEEEEMALIMSTPKWMAKTPSQPKRDTGYGQAHPLADDQSELIRPFVIFSHVGSFLHTPRKPAHSHGAAQTRIKSAFF
jgi:hypothetical protein